MLSRVAASRITGTLVQRARMNHRSGSRPWQRLQSTSSGSPSSLVASQIASGVVGGLTVALVGYTYYYTSGLRAAIQTVKDFRESMQGSRESIVAKTREVATNSSLSSEDAKKLAKETLGDIRKALEEKGRRS